MKNVILTLPSVTQALKARRLLTKNGISAKLIKLSSYNKGCTHAIEIPSGDIMNVAAILRSNEIPYSLK